MTTPERLRRRQRIEGACLIVIGLLMIAQGAYFHVDSRQSRTCIEENLAEFAQVMKIRSDLAERESQSEKAWQLILTEQAQLLKDNKLTDEEKKASKTIEDRLVVELLDYKREIRDIEQEREEHPVPPFPAGTCQD